MCLLSEIRELGLWPKAFDILPDAVGLNQILYFIELH